MRIGFGVARGMLAHPGGGCSRPAPGTPLCLLPLVVARNRREGRTGEGRFSGARRGSGSAFWQLPSLLLLSQACTQPGRAGSRCRLPASHRGHLERCAPLSGLRPCPRASGSAAGSRWVQPCPAVPAAPVLPVGTVRGQAGTARPHFGQRRREQVGGACCAVTLPPGEQAGSRL